MPELARWFNAAVEAGLVLVCDLFVLELIRLAPNEQRAREIADRLAVSGLRHEWLVPDRTFA